MDTITKIKELFDTQVKQCIKLYESIDSQTNSYDFEKSFRQTMNSFIHSLYQEFIGTRKVSKNKRMQLLTSFGEMTLSKDHPLAVSPGGFKISAYLQEQMCRVGTKMTFEEGEEELVKLLGIKVNAKQIERLWHHYGERLEQIDWRKAYNEGIQLRIPFDKQLYVLMDGSMLLTRDKEKSWKEVKLCRMFYSTDRVTKVSSGCNMLVQSRYVAHLGNREDFLDKVLEVLPCTRSPIFLADGAKWIWNWVEEYYPKATQILDFYHCKEHLYLFAKEYFAQGACDVWVDGCIEKLKTEQVDVLLKEIEALKDRNKHLQKAKSTLLTYLKNNRKRIN